VLLTLAFVVFWAVALLIPVGIGYVLRRNKSAVLVVVALVAAASFIPINPDSPGDDWRPVIFPFWAALSSALAVSGVWLGRRRRSTAARRRARPAR